MSGYEEPNYTQTPNTFFDVVMPQIETMTELKVTLAIIRQTHGWGKDEDVLSLTQLQALTGMRRESVVDGIERALKRGSIVRRPVGNTYAYAMKMVRKPDQKGRQGSPQTGPKMVRKPDTQKKEKESNTPSGADAPPVEEKKQQEKPSAFPLMGQYADQLDHAMPLSSKERGKLAQALQRRLDRGDSVLELKMALSRLVTRRKDGVRLELEDVLGDGMERDARRQHQHPPDPVGVSTAGYRKFGPS